MGALMTGVLHSYETILFDLDDTLIDTRTASFDACVASAVALGLDPPDQRRFFHTYGNASFQSCFRTWFGSPEGFREFAELYHQKVIYRSIGDIQAMLLSLQSHGIRLGIVTNSLQCEAEIKLRSANIPEWLLSFVVGRPLGYFDNSAPKPLGELLETYNINARFAVYISDNPVDAIAARHAGLTFKGVLTGVYGEDDFRAYNVPLTNVYRNVHLAVD
jgi:phosphoglycolate phosphatase-like HAD superfamily hydrolase